jgi:hypothetical protein
MISVGMTNSWFGGFSGQKLVPSTMILKLMSMSSWVLLHPVLEFVGQIFAETCILVTVQRQSGGDEPVNMRSS